MDVAYLLFTSATAAITTCDWDALIEYYFGELISTLHLLDSDAICPNKEQLHQQFRARAVLGAAFSLFSVPMRMLDRPPKNAISKFLDVSGVGQGYRLDIYSQESTRKLLRSLLLYFDEMNLLD